MKQWSQDPAQRPWFDHTDAAQRLEARRHAEPLSERDLEVLTQWMESRYPVVKSVVPDADIDGMLGDPDALWTASTPIDNLTIADLRVNPADPPGMTHSALLSLDRTTRERVKRQCL